MKEEIPEQTEFEIKVLSFDAAKKLMIIKEMKALKGIGLKEAKELVEKGTFSV